MHISLSVYGSRTCISCFETYYACSERGKRIFIPMYSYSYFVHGPDYGIAIGKFQQDSRIFTRDSKMDSFKETSILIIHNVLLIL